MDDSTSATAGRPSTSRARRASEAEDRRTDDAARQRGRDQRVRFDDDGGAEGSDAGDAEDIDTHRCPMPSSRPSRSSRRGAAGTGPRRDRRHRDHRGRRMGAKRGGITESEEIDYRMPPAEAAAPRQRRQGPRSRPSRDGEDGACAARGPQPLQDRGEADRHRHRPAREPLRAAARAGHEGRQDRPAQGRPRLRARLDRHQDPGPDPGQEGRRGRGAELTPQDGPPRRHLRRPARCRLAVAGLARQGHLRAGRLDGPGEDAARPRRRHHRLGQVGLGQRDPHLDAAACLAERAPAGPRRPQAGRAQPLRLGPHLLTPGGHERPGRHPTCSRTSSPRWSPATRSWARPAAATSRSSTRSASSRARRRCRTSSA